MIRIDYLNKDKEVRHSFVRKDEAEVWFEIVTIIKQGATDICVYNLDNALLPESQND